VFHRYENGDWQVAVSFSEKTETLASMNPSLRPQQKTISPAFGAPSTASALWQNPAPCAETVLGAPLL
jgi:hypothetical protein